MPSSMPRCLICPSKWPLRNLVGHAAQRCLTFSGARWQRATKMKVVLGVRRLSVPLLFSVLGQCGSFSATVRMKAMEDKITKAESLQVTVDSKLETKKGTGTFKGTLTLDVGNKKCGDLTMDFDDKSSKDAKCFRWGQNGKQHGRVRINPLKDTPKTLRSAANVMLARSGIVMLFLPCLSLVPPLREGRKSS